MGELSSFFPLELMLRHVNTETCACGMFIDYYTHSVGHVDGYASTLQEEQDCKLYTNTPKPTREAGKLSLGCISEILFILFKKDQNRLNTKILLWQWQSQVYSNIYSNLVPHVLKDLKQCVVYRKIRLYTISEIFVYFLCWLRNKVLLNICPIILAFLSYWNPG